MNEFEESYRMLVKCYKGDVINLYEIHKAYSEKDKRKFLELLFDSREKIEKCIKSLSKKPI